MMQYYKEKINDLKNVIDMMANINENLCQKIETLQNEHKSKEDSLQKRIDELQDEKRGVLEEISSSLASFSNVIIEFKSEIENVNSHKDRTNYHLKERLDYLNTKVMEIHRSTVPLYSDIKEDVKECKNESEVSQTELSGYSEISTEDKVEINVENTKKDLWGIEQ